jgi:hypothetical protein
MHSSQFPLLRVALVLVLAVTAGCGKSKMSAVSGAVTLDGKPLAGASVHFVPEGSGKDATAETDKDGQFTMSTLQPGDGVLPGTYKVVISMPLGTPDPTPYTTADDAMSGAAKAPAKKQSGPAVPAKYARPDMTPLTQEVPAKGKIVYELTSK